MKKQYIVGGIILVSALLVGGYAYWSQQGKEAQQITTSTGQTITVPTRMAEVNGTVLRIEGNELVINQVISSLSAEEQAAKRAERQAMTQEERQALRGQESETAQTEQVTVVIPVGVPIVVSSGDTSGTLKESSLEEIAVGSNLSIWKTSEGAIEIVKLKGL